MRVLIINSNQERSPWPVPPVGACAVASSAEQAGHAVKFLDLCFVTRTGSTVAGAIDQFRPEVIGISLRNIDNVDWQAPRFYLPRVKADVVDVCKASSDCPVVLGGPAAAIMPEEILRYMGADFVIRGDGEVAFVQLLEALESGGAVEDVPGLTYRHGGGVRGNAPALADDLDSLPAPRAHRWVDLARYLAYNGSLGVQTKRGCALKCTYCVYNTIEGPCYRLKSPQRVGEEVAEAVEVGKANSIEFVDSTFNIPLGHAMDVCRVLVEGGLSGRAHFSTMGINPAGATEELFGLLKEANFSEVSITPESASEAILKSLGKNFTVQDLALTADRARRARLPVVWYFMFGAPGEDEGTVAQTLRFIDEYIPPSHLVLMVSGIRIFKGAPLADRARREGQLSPDADLLTPVWYRPDIPPERLFALLDDAIAKHPNYIALRDNRLPRQLIRAASAVHRLFRCRRPLWQYMRYIRRLQTTLGLPQHLPLRAFGRGCPPGTAPKRQPVAAGVCRPKASRSTASMHGGKLLPAPPL